MAKLSDGVLENLRESLFYDGIIFNYRVLHAGRANVDFIERKNKLTKTYSYYSIDGKKVF